MPIQAPRGMKDVLPSESARWQLLERICRDTAHHHGYREIRTPVVEHTELFARGVGDTTDIVQKEMYTFADKGDRSLTLKPEGTAGVVRAFIEHGLFNDPLPAKMYYLNAPIFRYEAPQNGRLREHHQFGCEAFGAAGPSMDAEMIAIAYHTLQTALGKPLTVSINSIGCPTCRAGYHQALKAYLTPKLDRLCGTCKGRFEKNPLRILDCKVPSCQAELTDAPSILEYLCDGCAQHFDALQTFLTALSIPYRIDPRIVRGLDYYTRTVFEILVPFDNGIQLAACAGGRYDGLVEALGGSPMPGIGFGMGLERVLTMMPESKDLPTPFLYIAKIGDFTKEALQLCDTLRVHGFRVEMDHTNRSLKAQFKHADKLAATHLLLIGGDEWARGIVKFRDMQTRDEVEIPISNIISDMQKRM